MKQHTPFKVKGSKEREKVKSGSKLVTVNGHYTPEGLTYKGKRIESGIFVNVTGRTEKEKDRLFEKAKEELGEQARGLEVYGIIEI